MKVRDFVHQGTNYSIEGNYRQAMDHFHELRTHLHKMKLDNVNCLPIISGQQEFDDGTVATFSLVHGKEIVKVFAPDPGVEDADEDEMVPKEWDEDALVIPMLRVYDAPMGNHLGWAVYYTGRLEDGKCFFYEWDNDPDIPVYDFGINYAVLAEMIQSRRGIEGEAKCVPMYVRETENFISQDGDYKDDIFPECDVEYSCLSDFDDDLPGINGGKWYYNKEGMEDFVRKLNISDCTGMFSDNTVSVFEANWIHTKTSGWANTQYIKRNDKSIIVSSETLIKESDEYVYEPAFFLFQHFSNTLLSPCWSYYDNYPSTDNPIYYMRGHCPKLNEMGFWTLQVGSNSIANVNGESMLMHTLSLDSSIFFRYSNFNDRIQIDNGWYASYDPELDMFFTCRGWGANHSNKQTIKAKNFICDGDNPLISTSPYILATDYDIETTVSYAVGGRLLLNDSIEISVFEAAMYAIGDPREGMGYHDYTPDLTTIISSNCNCFYSTDKKKKNGLYHSANIADACCGIDTVINDGDWPTVFCGAIAFTSSENPKGTDPSIIMFTDIDLDYQAYSQGALGGTCYGVFLPLKMEDGDERYVLVTSNDDGDTTYRPEGDWGWDWGAQWWIWDRFVVRYTVEDQLGEND